VRATARAAAAGVVTSLAWASPPAARLVRIEIVRRESPALAGVRFGAVG
jgi:hypothetical protein